MLSVLQSPMSEIPPGVVGTTGAETPRRPSHPSAPDSPGAVESGIGASSWSLLLRARQGDRGALDALFARHLPALYRWSRGRLPRWAREFSDTNDVVQDAVLKTLARLEGFEPRREKALQAYLRQAVRNRIRDELRKVRRRPLPAELDPEQADTGPSPLHQAAHGEMQERYARALARLRDDDRELIVARLDLEYSYEQMALATGRPTPAAARVAVSRALLRLAREMAND